MSKEKLGQGIVYPEQENVNFVHYTTGMSKRFYAACAAMQGLLSNEHNIEFGPRVIAKSAYDFADELLRQEKEANDE